MANDFIQDAIKLYKWNCNPFDSNSLDSLKQQFTHSNIFRDFESIKRQLGDIKACPSYEQWLRDCYEFSHCNFFASVNKVSYCSEIYDLIINHLLRTDCLSKSELFEFITTFKKLFENYDKIFSDFIQDAFVYLLDCLNEDSISINIKIGKDLEMLSIPNILFDLMLDISNRYISQNIFSVSIFTCMPTLQFVTVTKYTNHHSIYTIGLANLSNNIIYEIKDKTLLLFFGLLSIFSPGNALKQFSSVLGVEFEETKIIKQYDNITLIRGHDYKNSLTGEKLYRFILPIHWNAKSDIYAFVNSAFCSIFRTTAIPGVINKDTGNILHVSCDEFKSCTWFDICTYQLSQFMNIQKSFCIAQESHNCFLTTAAYYLLENEQIIHKIWMNSQFWNVIPFDIGFFFLQNDDNNKILQSMKIPLDQQVDAQHLNEYEEIYVNENLKVVNFDQHRKLSFKTYVYLTCSQFSPPVRSLILEANFDNNYIIETYFPLWDPDLISIIPLSTEYIEKDAIQKIIKRKISLS